MNDRRALRQGREPKTQRCLQSDFFAKLPGSTKLGHAERNEVDLDTLETALVGAVLQTMQPQHASLWLQKSENSLKPDRAP